MRSAFARFIGRKGTPPMIPTLVSSLLVALSFAAPAAPPAPPARQLDFWVGDWTCDSHLRVAPDKDQWADGTVANHVRSILDGKAIEENFDGTGLPGGALLGKSLSVYDAQT